jgi:hypothetical protein
MSHCNGHYSDRNASGECSHILAQELGYMTTCEYLSGKKCTLNMKIVPEDCLFPKTFDDALIYAHWSYRLEAQPKYVPPEGISNNIHQILLAFEACKAHDRINAYRKAIKYHAIFGYTLSRTEYDHVLNLLRKAEEEMQPLKNTWLLPEQVKTAGIIGPAFAIYKIYVANCDEFRYITKTFNKFSYESDNVLDGQLRLVAIMHVDCAAVAGEIIAVAAGEIIAAAEIIAHDGARDLPF